MLSIFNNLFLTRNSRCFTCVVLGSEHPATTGYRLACSYQRPEPAPCTWCFRGTVSSWAKQRYSLLANRNYTRVYYTMGIREMPILSLNLNNTCLTDVLSGVSMLSVSELEEMASGIWPAEWSDAAGTLFGMPDPYMAPISVPSPSSDLVTPPASVTTASLPTGNLDPIDAISNANSLALQMQPTGADTFYFQ